MSKTRFQQHNLTFIGSGYVGLVSGTALADIGHNVILVDKNKQKIDTLKKGEIPIYEPGLDKLVEKNTAAGRLVFTTSLPEAMKTSDIIFIAVNTPSDDNGYADLTYVKSAAQEIAQHATSYTMVVNKSTVPVTTGGLIADILKKQNKHGVDFDVVSNPEFLREGTAIKDFMEGDRVVIGVSNDRAKKIMEEIYAPLDMPLFFTDIKSAELIKYASNSFLATKISFINAVARICELTGGNIDEVAKGIGMDVRINKHFLKAGIGWGGSCFPKDVAAFVKIAEKHGYNFDLLKDVRSINEDARLLFVEKIVNALGGSRAAKSKTVALWGLAFKPNTDDMRDAPAITVVEQLHKKGVVVQAYDPQAQDTAREVLGDKAVYMKDKYEALNNADVLAIVTEWEEFKNPDFDTVKQSLVEPIILDARNIFTPADMESKGFVYHSIGRG